MKITIEKTALQNALATTARVVGKSNTLPILSNILIEAEGDALRFTATDLDTTVHCKAAASIAESGAVAVPAAITLDVVSKLPDAPVVLEAQDGKVRIRCGKSNTTVLSLPAEDYPNVPVVNDGTELVIPQATLKEMLRMTTFATSNEETRSLLMGVLFEVRGDTLTLVATDTHRLALKKAKLAAALENPVTTVIPAKPLADMERMLKPSDGGTIAVRFGASQVRFQANGVTLISRLLDGQYPNYEKVIPQDLERKITFNRVALLEAVRRVYIIAKDAAEKAVFETKGEVLEITAESASSGKAFEEVPIAMNGEDIKIAFNVRYLVEVLGILSAENISIELRGALNPGLLRAVGNDDFQYVIMPMQV
jgi:DNA polymerase-3 subunit beta